MISIETIPTTPLSPPDRAAALTISAPSSARPFGRFLDQLGVRIDAGERLVENAATGSYAGLDAGQLIALQAGIYRYGEAVELGAKLVDRSASSVRVVLQAGH